MEHDLKVIARIRSPFPEKFGIPRQSGLVENLQGKIVFEPAYRNPDALRGMEEFSHLWLIWEFSENKREGWSPRCVRPVWEEMCAEEFLLPAHLFAPILWDYPV